MLPTSPYNRGMDADAANGPSGDTAEDVAELQRRRWREMSPTEKAAIVQALTRTTHELAAAAPGVDYRLTTATFTDPVPRLWSLPGGRP